MRVGKRWKDLDRQIIISNFNLCPLTQAPTLGTACLECEYVKNIEEEFFCIREDDENQDELSVKEIINMLLDLLTAGYTKIDRDEIKRIITDM